MKKYLIEAEVAGSISDSIFIDRTTRPRVIEKLVYTFDGWLGDDLIESVGTYIVTERLKDAIEKNKLTGCLFNEVEVIKSSQFIELYGDKKLPLFFWLVLNGDTNYDLSIKNCTLCLSEKSYAIFKEFNISNAQINEENIL